MTPVVKMGSGYSGGPLERLLITETAVVHGQDAHKCQASPLLSREAAWLPRGISMPVLHPASLNPLSYGQLTGQPGPLLSVQTYKQTVILAIPQPNMRPGALILVLFLPL